MSEWRPYFLKGPFLVSLQNSGAYKFFSMLFSALDFPAASKKSSQCRIAKFSANLNSNIFAEFCWTSQREPMKEQAVIAVDQIITYPQLNHSMGIKVWRDFII